MSTWADRFDNDELDGDDPTDEQEQEERQLDRAEAEADEE